jgi:parallel beta-helix repeat protein
MNESNEGDTVFVKNGTYKENIVLQDNVTLLGENVEKTIIKGHRGWPAVVGANGAIIKNFTITNGSVGILCKFTSPVISGNRIEHNRDAGIQTIISLPEIADNKIQNNGLFGIYLFSVLGSRTSIHGNTITGHSWSGIYCYNHTDVLIVKNTFVRNGCYGVFARDSHNSRVFENIFTQNKYPFNQMTICDNNNKVAENPDKPVSNTDENDTVNSYYGVAGKCNRFDPQDQKFPVERDRLRTRFFCRNSKKIYDRMNVDVGSDYADGIRSYKQEHYWDASVFFGKSLCIYPNSDLNVNAILLLAKSFMKLGLLQCATDILNAGLDKCPTSSYIVLYYLSLLEIAFLQENQLNIEDYYSHLENYCLTEDVRKECNRIRHLSENFNKIDTVKCNQQSPTLERNNKELTKFEEELFPAILSKQNPDIVDALKEYKAHYDEKFATVYECYYSSKSAELDFKIGNLKLYY